jgi:UPF0716 family protein affecting phage T7 exclusion
MEDAEITQTPKPRGRTAAAAVAWTLILAGIAGLLLPVLPGVPLLIAGILMLSPQNAWLRRMLEKIRGRVPFLDRSATRLSGQNKNWQSFFRNIPGGP